MFCVIIDRLLVLLSLWYLVVNLKEPSVTHVTTGSVFNALTSKASSRSGAGPVAASFLGALPSASALWNATGWSRELYLVEDTSTLTTKSIP